MPKVMLKVDLLRRRIQQLYGTQSAFAARCGWTRQYVSRLLAGSASVSAQRAAEIALLLGLRLEELITHSPAAIREAAVAYSVQNSPLETETYIDPESGLLMRRSRRRFVSEDERRAFVDSLLGKYRDTLPPVEEFLRRKHEESERDEEPRLRHGL